MEDSFPFPDVLSLTGKVSQASSCTPLPNRLVAQIHGLVIQNKLATPMGKGTPPPWECLLFRFFRLLLLLSLFYLLRHFSCLFCENNSPLKWGVKSRVIVAGNVTLTAEAGLYLGRYSACFPCVRDAWAPSPAQYKYNIKWWCMLVGPSAQQVETEGPRAQGHS